MQAAITDGGKFPAPATRRNCISAASRILRDAGVAGQYPCSEIYLFGVCTPRPASEPACKRCSAAPAPGRPIAAFPPGARAAIKAACSDPAIAAGILAG